VTLGLGAHGVLDMILTTREAPVARCAIVLPRSQSSADVVSGRDWERLLIWLEFPAPFMLKIAKNMDNYWSLHELGVW